MADGGLDLDRERYARHLVIPEVGVAGQLKLRSARVLLVGVGGLGSPVALYLAAAGVGTIGLVDPDLVERSNLQRQVLFGERDVGRPKVEAAAERLRDFNPAVQLEAERIALDPANARALVKAFDVVVDGSDNFATRYLVNDACGLEGKPDVFGSVHRWSGQVTVFWAGHGPCYRCLHPAPPPLGSVPSCAEAGVLGVLPGMVGTLLATQTLLLLLGVGQPLLGRLLLIDALSGRQREIAFRRHPACPLCGSQPMITSPTLVYASCAPALSPEKPMPDSPPLPFAIDVQQLAAWRESGRPFQLLDVRTPHEASLASLPGARLIPLPELPRRLAELDPNVDLVVHCHIGGRSAQAVHFLRGNGFVRSTNLAGGIDAWSCEIDPEVPRY